MIHRLSFLLFPSQAMYFKKDGNLGLNGLGQRILWR
jgi:hypothetical protein